MRSMMSATTLLIAVTAGLLLCCAPSAEAWAPYMSKIPNAANVKRNGVSHPGVGHNATNGGGVLNVFGLAFMNANHTWSTALCQADSDADGQTNGFELGDPDCVWTVGATPSRTTDISHPGFADSMSTAVAVAVSASSASSSSTASSSATSTSTTTAAPSSSHSTSSVASGSAAAAATLIAAVGSALLCLF